MKNQAAMAIWQLLIVGGVIEPPVGTHQGFFTGPFMPGLTGSMFKKKGRKRADEGTQGGQREAPAGAG
jgi:hypothetical protein